MTDNDDNDVETLAEQNRKNIAAIASAQDIGDLTDEFADDDGMGKLAAALGGGSAVNKDEDDSEELSGEERTAAIQQQNAENLVALADHLGVAAETIVTSATDDDESGKGLDVLVSALGTPARSTAGSSRVGGSASGRWR